jgi:hypothetical protein
MKSSKMVVCKICSMCENMTICMEIWLLLDIYVKYAQCVKIWPFVWKFDFHLIFCENMAVSEVCAVFEILCLVSDGNYTEFGDCSISDEEKGRRAIGTCILHLIKRRCIRFVCISHMGKGRCALTKRVSLLPKRTINMIFTKGWFLHQQEAFPLVFF